MAAAQPSLARRCAVCGESAARKPVLRGLDSCTSCGFVDYDVSAVNLAAVYNDAYFHGGDYPDYLGQEESLRRSMRRHLEQMAGFGVTSGALLEVGCAYGFFLDEARRRSFSPVVGVDVCEGPVTHARNVLALDARAGNVESVGLAASSFDVVCAWDTIEHVPDPDVILTEIRRLLKPGGRLFLTTGDLGSFNARIRGSRWRQIHPPTHVNYFSRATMRTLLSRLGFRTVGIETTAYYHSMYNVLATLALRGGASGRLSAAILAAGGTRVARRVGFWIDLGDIMFVVAERPC